MRAWLAILALIAGCAGVGSPQDKVVYHFSEGLAQAPNGLRNIGNHLEVNPGARIVVVSHAASPRSPACSSGRDSLT